MKRRACYFLIILSIALLLPSCDRMGELPAESVAHTNSAESDGEGGSLDELVRTNAVFPIEGLFGATADALSQAYGQAIYYDDMLMESTLDTSAYLLLRGSALVPCAYDKKTGTFSVACRDPLCSHEDCIWQKSGTLFYSGGDLLFFVKKEEHAIYVSDLYGENPKMLYSNNGDAICHLVRDGDDLYFLEEGINPQTETSELRILHLKLSTGRAEVLLEGDTFYNFMPVNGCLLYQDLSDSCVYLYDPENDLKTEFGREIVPYAFYKGWIYYHAEDGFYRADVLHPEVRERIFEDACYTVCFSGDRMVLSVSTVFSESDAFGRYYQTALYAADLDGSNLNFVMDFLTNGIPDRIDEAWANGNMLIVCYRTYLDFQNEFNPNGTRGASHMALIDLSTGKRIVWEN